MNRTITARDSLQRKLILSSLLSAITVIFYLFASVPVLNIVGILFCPVPLTLIGFIYGLGPGILSLCVTTVLVFLFMGLLQAYFFLSVFGFLGVVVGYVTRLFLDPFRVAVYSIIIILVFNLFFYYGVEKLLNLEDMMKELKEMMVKAIGWIFQYLSFIPAEGKVFFLKYINVHVEVPIMLFFIISFAMFYMDFLVSGLSFKRFRIPFPEFPPLPLWKIPRELTILLVVSACACLLLRGLSGSFPLYFMLNIFSIAYVSLFFLGYSLIAYFMAVRRVKVVMRLLALPLIIVLNFIPVILAVADSFFNLRRLSS